MKEIKTKGSKKDISVLDKSVELAAKMKRGLSRTKEQAQNLSDNNHTSPDEYAQENIKYASEDLARNAAHGTKETVKRGYDGSKRLVQQIKQKRRDGDSIKQTAKSTGKQTFKTMERNIKTAGQSAQRNLKTAEQTARTTIKTTEKAAKSAEKTVKAAEKAAKVSAKAAKVSAETAKKTAEAAAKAAKTAIKATIAAIKAIAAGTKSLVTAIAAGGWVAVIIIIVIVMVAMIVGSCFGIFFSDSDTGSGMSMRTAISNIDAEYHGKIEEMKNSVSYDILKIQGDEVAWKNVLAVYAVKTASVPQKVQEVASMDSKKYEILRGVFWDMYELSKSTETKKEKITTVEVDKDGKIVEKETTITRTYLYICIQHKTPEEMKSVYGFNDSQKKQLDELLSDENEKLWSGLQSL